MDASYRARVAAACAFALGWGSCARAPCERPRAEEREQEDREQGAHEDAVRAREGGEPPTLPSGLLIAASVAGEGDRPSGGRLELVAREGGAWRRRELEDPDSEVLHHARCWDPEGPLQPGIVTLGGGAALAKHWSREGDTWRGHVLWRSPDETRWARLRDGEVGRVLGGAPTAGGLVGDVLVVGTHDQGVVALLAPDAEGGVVVTELDRRPATLVHEVELGDLDGDGALEVYASLSPPNALTRGVAQPGSVVRYEPSTGMGATVIADLAPRHAKEILVDDVDGDGRDELYVVVEGQTEGEPPRVVTPVEILRFDAGRESVVIARIEDRATRFLTAGDLDGDGRRELVAAAFSTGLWWLVPGRDPRSEWGIERLAADEGGFEHAALLADLDEDGRDELYSADDASGELRRHVWNGHGVTRTVLRRVAPRSRITWSLASCPRAWLTD